MNSFFLRAEQEISILGEEYTVLTHPSAPGIPFGQEGKSGVVYCLCDYSGERYALKVFKSTLRGVWIQAASTALEPYKDFPGLRVANRWLIFPTTSSELLTQYPGLLYAVLMPWIQGKSFLELFLEAKSISFATSTTIAYELAKILSRLESHGLAHSDISATNVIVNMETHEVQLVGLERFYKEGIPRPALINIGSPGYGCPHVSDTGQWCASGDRFAGAVLISEILGRSDTRIVEDAFGESYFNSSELCEPSRRYDLLHTVLQEISPAIAQLFEVA
jgi:serine/threonine protein kinase